MVTGMGIELLTGEQYRALQKFENVELGANAR